MAPVMPRLNNNEVYNKEDVLLLEDWDWTKPFSSIILPLSSIFLFLFSYRLLF